jgi:hypothetical protein
VVIDIEWSLEIAPVFALFTDFVDGLDPAALHSRVQVYLRPADYVCVILCGKLDAKQDNFLHRKEVTWVADEGGVSLTRAVMSVYTTSPSR